PCEPRLDLEMRGQNGRSSGDHPANRSGTCSGLDPDDYRWPGWLSRRLAWNHVGAGLAQGSLSRGKPAGGIDAGIGLCQPGKTRNEAGVLADLFSLADVFWKSHRDQTTNYGDTSTSRSDRATS